VSITRDVMAVKGTTDLKHIRTTIDAKYAQYGRGTPTGMP
jgi:hypothetical protein